MKAWKRVQAIRKTFDAELDNMANISKIIESVDSIYLIGCGSSISTCYSVRDALASVSTNYELFNFHIALVHHVSYHFYCFFLDFFNIFIDSAFFNNTS